jgi:hypothetical protein
MFLVSEFARKSVALTQASLGAIEWARDAVRLGQIEPYAQQGVHSMIRGLGVSAVGRIAECAPKFGIEFVLGRLVLPEHEVLSIGAEAVVIDEAVRVRKVMTGKTQNPSELAERMEQKQNTFKYFMEQYAVSDTEIDSQPFRVFKWLPEMEYMHAVQPMLDIYKPDVLEDDEFIRRNPKVRKPLQDVLNRLQRHTQETGDAYDTAKVGNVVLLRTEPEPEGADKYWCPEDVQIRLPDVMIANLEDEDFAGLPLPFSGIWTPHIYPAATNGHAERLAA